MVLHGLLQCLCKCLPSKHLQYPSITVQHQILQAPESKKHSELAHDIRDALNVGSLGSSMEAPWKRLCIILQLQHGSSMMPPGPGHSDALLPRSANLTAGGSKMFEAPRSQMQSDAVGLEERTALLRFVNCRKQNYMIIMFVVFCHSFWLATA